VLRDRLLSAAILAPPVIVAGIVGGVWTIIAVMIVFGLTIIEYTHLVARRGHRASAGLMLLWALLFCINQGYPQLDLLGPLMAVVLVVSMAWMLIRYKQGTANAFTGLAMTITGALYFGWSGSHLVGIRAFEDGAFWLTMVLITTWSTDAAAYFGGWAFGRTPLLPEVSPKKTFEGYFSGIVGGSIVAAGLTFLGQKLGTGASVSFQHTLVLSVLIGVLTPIGDLGWSVLKRYTDAKDSSNLIPGHGGFLDRADTVYVSSVLVYYYLDLLVF